MARPVLLALCLASAAAADVDLLGDPVVAAPTRPAAAPAPPAVAPPAATDATVSDFLTAWRLQGPFPAPFTAAPLGPEAALAREGRLATWKAATCDPARPGDWLHAALDAANAKHCFAYAVAAVDSPVAQAAELRIGSDDGYSLWLNGAPVGTNLEAIRPVRVDQDRHQVKLARGRNLLLVKILQVEGGWGMCVRFAGLDKPVKAVAP